MIIPPHARLQFVTVVPSGTITYPVPARAVRVETGGNLRYRNSASVDITLSSVAPGLLFIDAVRIWATGTTATGVTAAFAWITDTSNWSDINIQLIPDWGAIGFNPVKGNGKFQRSLNHQWRYTGKPADEIPTTGFTDRYVDPIIGDDGNDGTSPTQQPNNVGPWKSLEFALNVLNITNLRIIIPDKSVFDFRALGGRPWSTLVRRVPRPSKTIVINASALAGNFDQDLGWRTSTEMERKTGWTQVGSTSVYFSEVFCNGDDNSIPDFDWKSGPNAIGGSSLQTGCIIDEALTDQNGPTRYLQVNSSSDVSAAPFTYAYVRDTVTRLCTVYINTGSSDPASTEGIRVFANTYGGSFDTANFAAGNTKELYVINGTFEGGHGTFVVAGTDGKSNANLITFWQCVFRYSKAGRAGLSVDRPCEVRSFYSTAYANGNDGITYTSTMSQNQRSDDYLIRVLEVGCRSFWNGSTAASITVNGTPNSSLLGKVNGYTSHQGAKVVRVGAIAHSNGGANYGDAASSGYIRTLNLGCYSWRSLGSTTKSEGKVQFAVYGYSGSLPEENSATQSGAIVWLLDFGYWSELGEITLSDNILFMTDEQVGQPARNVGRIQSTDDFPTPKVVLDKGATELSNFTKIVF